MDKPTKQAPTREELTAKRIAKALASEEQLAAQLGPKYAIPVRTVYDGDTPPVEWIVPGAIPRANVTLITGESGAKKTWVAYELIRAVVSGTGWMHRAEPLPQREAAIILNYDMPTPTMRRRAKQIGISHDMPAYFHSLGLSQIEPGSIQKQLLVLPEAATALKYVLRWVQPSVILVDSFRQAQTMDENDSAEMGKLMGILKSWTQINRAAVVIIHHTTKSGPGKWTANARGSGEIPASADVIIEVEENKMMWKKHRPWEISGKSEVTFQLYDSYLDLGIDDDVLKRTKVKAMTPLPGEDDQRQVRTLVDELVKHRQLKFVSPKELEKALKWNADLVRKAAANAQEQQLIEVVRTKTGNGYRIKNPEK